LRANSRVRERNKATRLVGRFVSPRLRKSREDVREKERERERENTHQIVFTRRRIVCTANNVNNNNINNNKKIMIIIVIVR